MLSNRPTDISSEGYTWIQYGEWHRKNDQPVIIRSNDCLYWFIREKYHRAYDLPSIINGQLFCWKRRNGEHRKTSVNWYGYGFPVNHSYRGRDLIQSFFMLLYKIEFAHIVLIINNHVV